MKTIRNIFAILLTMTVVAVLSSCGKDPQIYGKWKIVSITATDGEQSETLPFDQETTEDFTVEFKKNGQIVLAMAGVEVTKEYTLHGDHIVLIDWYGEHILEPGVDEEHTYDIQGIIKTLTKTDMSIELFFSEEDLEAMEEDMDIHVIVDFERAD